jgi:hypothetical protein
MSKFVVGAAALVVLCSGCASITQGTTHPLRIDTETAQGQVIEDADCELTNDQGTMYARSGNSTFVRRSSKDLEIRCVKPGLPDASARLVSRANAGLAGNVLIGGALGAMLDHSSGAAYTYPTWVKLRCSIATTNEREESSRLRRARPRSCRCARSRRLLCPPPRQPTPRRSRLYLPRRLCPPWPCHRARSACSLVATPSTINSPIVCRKARAR